MSVIPFARNFIPSYLRSKQFVYPQDAAIFQAAGLLPMIHTVHLIDYACKHLVRTLTTDSKIVMALEAENYAQLNNAAIDALNAVDVLHMPMLSILQITLVLQDIDPDRYLELQYDAINMDIKYRTKGLGKDRLKPIDLPEYSQLTRFIYHQAFGRYEPSLDMDGGLMAEPMDFAHASDLYSAASQVQTYYNHDQQAFLRRYSRES